MNRSTLATLALWRGNALFQARCALREARDTGNAMAAYLAHENVRLARKYHRRFMATMREYRALPSFLQEHAS